MRKSDPIKQNDMAFAVQMKTFKNNIGGYAAAIGVTAAQITGQGNDADYYDYLVKCQVIMSGSGQQWTSWRDLTRDGGTPPPGGAPVLPTLPTAVTAVAPGIESRFRALIQQIKINPNYNESIGLALDIEGAHQSGPDLTTVQPDFDLSISGNQVFVGWGWGGNGAYLDVCEIWVDRGDGKGFVLLTYDTTPGYTDTTPFPATPAKWTYKAIFRVGDAQVGLWSKLVSIIVGG